MQFFRRYSNTLILTFNNRAFAPAEGSNVNVGTKRRAAYAKAHVNCRQMKLQVGPAIAIGHSQSMRSTLLYPPSPGAPKIISPGMVFGNTYSELIAM